MEYRILLSYMVKGKTIKIDTSIQHTGQIFNKAKVSTENKSFFLYQWKTKKKKEREGAPSGVDQS